MRRHRGAPVADPRHPGAASVVPAVLPQVIVTINDAGHARITADRIARPNINDPDEPVDRRDLGTVLARIAEQAGGPVRVEVREADGSRYADILQPQPEPDDPPGPHDATSPVPVVLEGEGFLPGEPVLVAVVATTVLADHDGTVRLPSLPRIPGDVGELILFGANSGTILCDTALSRSVRRRRP